ncbi:MAG: coenzyme F420-0:L-glutamate ligase [Parcubacteria group bacterium]|nr:coenzyme F420-0:L-glutamate ligase [Parcubacteria group bacterium]
MKVTAIKTRRLVPPQDDLLSVIKESISEIPERSVFAVTSKVVSIWQGRCVKKEEVSNKDELVKRQAEKFIPRELVPGEWALLTIKNNILIPATGIDESMDGYYVLWPKKVNAAAQELWDFLRKTYNVNECGVIITDSHTVPLRRGVVGIALGYFGFEPLKRYGMISANLVDSLASAAVLTMGEGAERTPLALITEVPFMRFLDHPYKSTKLFSSLEVNPSEDIYKPFWDCAPWEDGGKEE